MSKYDASITWLETGIEYYQNLLRRVMHKEIRRAYKGIIIELESAIEVLRKEGK